MNLIFFFFCRFDFVSDFDLMLMKKKDEMRKRKKRRRDVDIINDNDDLIVDMIVKMKEAAEVIRLLMCRSIYIVHVGSVNFSDKFVNYQYVSTFSIFIYFI